MRVRIPRLPPCDVSTQRKQVLVNNCPDGEMEIIPRFERDVAGSTPARGAEFRISALRFRISRDGACGVAVSARLAVNQKVRVRLPPRPLRDCDRSVLLGEQAASKTAAQGSNPCAPADWPTWLDRERRRTRNADHAGANPVVGSYCPRSVVAARDPAKVVDQVQFLAGTLDKSG